MSSNARLWLIVAIGLSLTTVGCGGSSKPPAGAPVAPAVNAPAANARPLPAPARPAPAEPAAATGNTEQNAAAEEGSESADPGQDDFEINPDQTVLELAGTAPPPPPQRFDVLPLPAGQNSTTLQIVNADGTSAFTAVSNPQPAANAGTEGSRNSLPKAASGLTQAPPEVTAAGWRWPIGATAVPGSETDPETGLPMRITIERDAVEMVLIPPGVFLEGTDGHDSQSGPQHSVLLETPYYIDVTEVTIRRYDAFRDTLRKSEGRRMEPAINHDSNPETPAVGIKFLDAKYFAKWAGKDLPTEAQWERAARGREGFDYPWGNGRPIWHQARKPGQLHPVATFAGDRSPDGVYDMAGNAREWCLDLYSPDTYEKDVATGGSTVRNPAGPKTLPGPKLQVIRGSKTDWAVWQRAGQPQGETAADLGFRCVINVTAAPKEDEKSSKKGNVKKKKPQAF